MSAQRAAIALPPDLAAAAPWHAPAKRVVRSRRKIRAVEAPVPKPKVAFDPEAAIELGRWLQRIGYRFTTVTPATHQRVNGRAGYAHSLRDIFGWSRPFTEDSLPRALLELLERGNLVERTESGELHTVVRFSTIDDLLFVHSAFPTADADAVFFGPDTYRFASLIRRTLKATAAEPVRRIVDIGCGSGAGGLLAARMLAEHQPRLVLADVNPAALRCAVVSASLTGAAEVECIESDLLRSVPGSMDLVICNPPYLIDPAARTYRHGGDSFGSGLALRVVNEALARLAPGGRLILYTGAPVIEGIDQLRRAVEPALRQVGAQFEYEELDPDVFGEELDAPAYSIVDRIAAVGLVVRMPGAAA